ncbi:MAG: hypothetical protein Q9181_003776 [Wetmoreana brouardii]
MSKKRRREPSSIDTQLVEIYEDLASESEDIRLKAAHALLSKFSVDNGQSSEQLSEVVRRLIRGLCSGRKAARIGFSVALTELLAQRWGQGQAKDDESTQIQELIDVLVKQTETSGNVSGQEERDHQFGRLFCAEAFIKSGILFQPSASEDAWPRILGIVYEAARKKPWLREECGWVLYGAVQTLKQRCHELRFVQALVDKLCHYGLAKTPEGVAIWLKVQQEFPQGNLPDGVWRDCNPLHRKEKSKLAKILKEASDGNSAGEPDGQVSQKSNWTSKLHFVWSVIFPEITRERSKKGTSKIIGFAEFWREAVDEHLFALSSSEERKYWGFLLFQQLFSSMPISFLPDLFSHNFMRCLINQLASKERYLHRVAEKTIKSILDRVELEPSAAYAALKGLLSDFSDGNFSFDQTTKTRTVERLITLADTASLSMLVPTLYSKLINPGAVDDRTATARRQLTADQLISFLKSRRPTEDTDSSRGMRTGNMDSSLTTPIEDTDGSLGEKPQSLVEHILEVLMKVSYFLPQATQTEDNPNPPISDKTREMLRTRLSSCLTHIIGKFPNPSHFVYRVVSTMWWHHNSDAWRSYLDLTGSIQDGITNAWMMLKQVHEQASSESGNKTFLDAFDLLCSLTILQIYNGDADAVSMLDELQDCYNLLIKRREEGKEQGAEVLVEVLLGFAAKPSQLFRRLAQQVFGAFASEISRNGLQSMIKVLETKENLLGQDEMFEQDNEEGQSTDSTSSDDSDVEVEMVDVNGADRSSDLAISGSSEDTEDSDAEDNQELAAFDMKLAQALKTKPLNADPHAASDESSPDEDMDDEQMEALDDHIATMFKERKKVVSRKTQKKDAKETIVNFKCRVLELLEIFIKKRHMDLLALDLLLPLLTVVRTTSSSLVSGKACNLMREYSRLCKGKAVPQIEDKSEIVKLLKAVHAEAMLESSNAHASACSQASLLLVKILVAADRDNLRKVVKTYASTQEAVLMDPNCRVKMSFFTDWLNWCSTARPGR